ncbi:MAG: hypothetical protein WBM08_01990 [Prochlorococcaceae cyanobacterium]
MLNGWAFPCQAGLQLCANTVPSLPPDEDPDDWAVERGRPFGLRLLAFVGALAFVMLGINSLLPLLQPQKPPSLPEPPKAALG